MLSVSHPTSGKQFAQAILVMRPTCVHCNTPLVTEQRFYAVGAPYYAALHEQCAPLFRFDGRWPHPGPLVAYAGD